MSLTKLRKKKNEKHFDTWQKNDPKNVFTRFSQKKLVFSDGKKNKEFNFPGRCFPPPVLKSNTQERKLFTSYQENGSPENPFDPFSKSDLK